MLKYILNEGQATVPIQEINRLNKLAEELVEQEAQLKKDRAKFEAEKEKWENDLIGLSEGKILIETIVKDFTYSDGTAYPSLTRSYSLEEVSELQHFIDSEVNVASKRLLSDILYNSNIFKKYKRFKELLVEYGLE